MRIDGKLIARAAAAVLVVTALVAVAAGCGSAKKSSVAGAKKTLVNKSVSSNLLRK